MAVCPQVSCGFCIFNNVAVGAMHALNHHHLDRVAIVDIDVHHGNGERPRCKVGDFFCSVCEDGAKLIAPVASIDSRNEPEPIQLVLAEGRANSSNAVKEGLNW